jgi:cAMP-specific phosphodiesterase 4
MFDNLDVLQRWKIDPTLFSNFLHAIASGYRASNSYHNFHHACDVTHVCYRMLTLSQIRNCLQRVEILALMISALAHDIDHPGNTNAFLVGQRDALAIVYNDQSVLENHHAATLYKILLKSKTAILSVLDAATWTAVRKVSLRTILATDNQFHFKHMTELNVFLDMHQEQLDEHGPYGESGAQLYAKGDDKQLLLDMMLHCSDISNPWKPWKLCEKWSNAIRVEFFAQAFPCRATVPPLSYSCRLRARNVPSQTDANLLRR